MFPLLKSILKKVTKSKLFDAINDNDGDIAAQQSLNDLMEQQLAYLRDK